MERETTTGLNTSTEVSPNTAEEADDGRRGLLSLVLGLVGAGALAGCTASSQEEDAPLGKSEAPVTAASVKFCATMADLRTEAVAANVFAVLSGYLQHGDGGGGVFIWDAGATIADDTGTVIAKTGTSAGRWRRVFSGPLDVRWFGASASGDVTAAIQKTVDTAALLEKSVTIPKGTYQIDGVIDAKVSMQLDGVLKRIGNATSTRPVLKITQPRVIVSGSGQVQSEKSSPDGIVLFGIESPAFPPPPMANILWSRLQGIKVTGASFADSRGVAFQSQEAWGGSSSLYCCWLSDVLIEGVDIGVYFGARCNGHSLRDVHFYQIGKYSIYMNGNDAYQSRGVSENTVVGMFTHFSASLLASIRVDRGDYCNFYSVSGEPGGVTASLFTLDQDSLNCHVFGVDNHYNAPINNAKLSTIVVGPMARIGGYAQIESHRLAAIADTVAWQTLMSFKDHFAGLVVVRAVGADPGGLAAAWRSKVLHVGFTSWAWSAASGQLAVLSSVGDSEGYCPDFECRIVGTGSSADLQVRLLTAQGCILVAETFAIGRV